MQPEETPTVPATASASAATAESLPAESVSAPPPVPPQDAASQLAVTPKVAELEEKLREALQKAAEHHDAWLRAKAEGENIRRRAQDDILKAHKYAIERFAADLLVVKDSLEAALASQNQSVESLQAGVDLTLKQLEAAFGKSGLKEINPVNEKFDPHFHQAISALESDQEPNTVVNVLQKGYLIADRVLRPALVMVAKPRTAQDQGQAT